MKLTRMTMILLELNIEHKLSNRKLYNFICFSFSFFMFQSFITTHISTSDICINLKRNVTFLEIQSTSQQTMHGYVNGKVGKSGR